MGPGGWTWATHPWVVALAVLGTVILWGLVVTAIVRMLRPHGPPPPAGPPSPSRGEHPR